LLDARRENRRQPNEDNKPWHEEANSRGKKFAELILFFTHDEFTQKLASSKSSETGLVDFFDSHTQKCDSKLHFFLDTVFQEPYTFRNCNTRVADSMQIEIKGE